MNSLPELEGTENDRQAGDVIQLQHAAFTAMGKAGGKGKSFGKPKERERKDREIQPHDRSEEIEAHRAEVEEQMFEMRHHRATGPVTRNVNSRGPKPEPLEGQP